MPEHFTDTSQSNPTEAERIARSRELVQRADALLRKPAPDTFLGRQQHYDALLRDDLSSHVCKPTVLAQKSGGLTRLRESGDRNMLFAHLAASERHIAQGQIRVERQERRIAELKRDGHETAGAIAILTTMKQTQELHLGDRDHIFKELQNQ
jgi:hypothetical protein